MDQIFEDQQCMEQMTLTCKSFPAYGLEFCEEFLRQVIADLVGIMGQFTIFFLLVFIRTSLCEVGMFLKFPVEISILFL